MLTALALCTATSLLFAGSAVSWDTMSSERLEGKRAWAWTDRERLAARYDPTFVSHRLATAIQDKRVGGDVAQVAVIIDGDRNPELIMPAELMAGVAMAYSDDPGVRGKWRAQWAAGSEFLGEDFWPRLYVACRPFIDADVESSRLQREMRVAPEGERENLKEKWSAVNASICPTRAGALAAARATFGRERFDRFLYEVIARGQVVRSTAASTPEASAEMLLWIEGGCQ